MRLLLVLAIIVGPAVELALGASNATFGLSEKSLSELKKAGLSQDARVAIFFNVLQGCPLVQKYQKTLKELGTAYHSEQVAVFNIDSSVTATRDKEETIRYLKQLGNPFPLFIDQKARIAKELGLKVASETAVVDMKSSSLVFRGPIDDQHRIEFSRPQPTRRYVIEAIERILDSKAGTAKKDSPEIIEPFGCLINLGPP